MQLLVLNIKMEEKKKLVNERRNEMKYVKVQVVQVENKNTLVKSQAQKV